MKTIFSKISLSIVLMLAGLGMASAQSTNDQALIGRAHQAAHACIALAHQLGFHVDGFVVSSGVCPDGSESKTVTFIGQRHCPPMEPCPLIALLVASVTFDCEGNIVATTCNQ